MPSALYIFRMKKRLLPSFLANRFWSECNIRRRRNKIRFAEREHGSGNRTQKKREGTRPPLFFWSE